MFASFGSHLLNLDAVVMVDLDHSWEEEHPRPTGRFFSDHSVIYEIRRESHTGIRVYCNSGPFIFDDADSHTAELRQALAQLAPNASSTLQVDVLPGGSFRDQQIFAGLPADLQAKIKEVS